jgi:hypothetical protein
MLNLFLATNGPWFEQPLPVDMNNNNVDHQGSTVLRWSLPQSVSGDAVSIMNCSLIAIKKYQPVRICCNLLLDTDFNPEGLALALTIINQIS